MAVSGHGSENKFLLDTELVGQAKLTDAIARSFAGRVRHLYELLTGTNPFPDEQPASLFNPQRKLGHDHSGPPFGSAFLHPIAWWSWGKANAANVIRPRFASGAEFYEDGIHSGTSVNFGPLFFWNRPHYPLPQKLGLAPYSNLVLYVLAHKKAADADLGVTLHAGEGDDHQAFSDIVTITSTTMTGYVVDSGGNIANGLVPALHFPARGGRNRLALEFTSAAASADAITIDAWALCNVRKRRWLNP